MYDFNPGIHLKKSGNFWSQVFASIYLHLPVNGMENTHIYQMFDNLMHSF